MCIITCYWKQQRNLVIEVPFVLLSVKNCCLLVGPIDGSFTSSLFQGIQKQELRKEKTALAETKAVTISYPSKNSLLHEKKDCKEEVYILLNEDSQLLLVKLAQ